MEAVPDTVQNLKNLMVTKCKIDNDFVVQHEDKDFGELVNLTNVAFLENLLTLKVIQEASDSGGYLCRCCFMPFYADEQPAPPAT